ncbi:hypothetical protein FKM82_025923, partial [Ascaphus truei]
MALRLPVSTLKQEVFKEDLKELRIPEDFIGEFANIVYGSRRPVLENAAMKQGVRLPTVEALRWRVDVAISTSSLARALQPSILMQLKLSDGTSHRLEVSLCLYHRTSACHSVTLSLCHSVTLSLCHSATVTLPLS